MIEGHGGVLDRLHSVVFSALIVFHLALLVDVLKLSGQRPTTAGA